MRKRVVFYYANLVPYLTLALTFTLAASHCDAQNQPVNANVPQAPSRYGDRLHQGYRHEQTVVPSRRDPFAQQQQVQNLGPPPNYQRARDVSPGTEPPQPVTVDQSKTQDLSLPEDNSGSNTQGSTRRQHGLTNHRLQDQVRKPFQNLRNRFGL